MLTTGTWKQSVPLFQTCSTIQSAPIALDALVAQKQRQSNVGRYTKSDLKNRARI